MQGYFVYFLYNLQEELLYIGKTGALTQRLNYHFYNDLSMVWKTQIDKNNVVVFRCKNSCDLDVYETYFINKYRPKYNKDKVFGSELSFDLPFLQPEIYNICPNRKKRTVLKDVKKYISLKNKEYQNEPEQSYLEFFETTNPSLVKLVNSLNIQTVFELGNHFKELVFTLKEKYYSEQEEDILILNFILTVYPWLPNLISKVGFKKAIHLIEREKYIVTNILRKSTTYFDSETKNKILTELNNYPEINVNNFISAKELKQIFKSIYSKLSIKRNPKGADLQEFYEVQDKSKRIQGVTTQGYLILRQKLVDIF